MTEGTKGEMAKGKDESGDQVRWIAAGAAAGIGSAALVAALLYANRSKKPAANTPVAPMVDKPETD